MWREAMALVDSRSGLVIVDIRDSVPEAGCDVDAHTIEAFRVGTAKQRVPQYAK